jgi:hypothetical protein
MSFRAGDGAAAEGHCFTESVDKLILPIRRVEKSNHISYACSVFSFDSSLLALWSLARVAVQSLKQELSSRARQAALFPCTSPQSLNRPQFCEPPVEIDVVHHTCMSSAKMFAITAFCDRCRDVPGSLEVDRAVLKRIHRMEF